MGFRGIAVEGPTLCHHVSHVLGVGPQPKMLDVAANAVVAGVTDVNTWRDGTVCEHPREAMGVDLLGVTDPYVAITGSSGCPSPLDATRVSNYEVEGKAVDERCENHGAHLTYICT